ncbi:MAG: DNA-binding protein WhiA [Mycoplasmataceae bacterium]|nr:DNA-binding protein WhiA [Mycoplasmataceae bacterium]
MNKDKRSFSEQVKTEIINYPWATLEEKNIFLYSFIRTTGRFTDGKYIFKTTLIEHEADFRKLYLEVFQKPIRVEKTKTLLKFIIEHPKILSNLASIMGDFTISTAKETKAYLAGSFLGTGWVNSFDSKYYHFEIRIKHFQHSLDLKEAFETMNIKTMSLRKNCWYYVYIKKAQDIADVLKIINATSSAIIFEDHRIEKQFLATIKKMNSIEPYNKKKTDKTCTIQKKHCKSVLQNQEIQKLLTVNQLKLAKLRLNRENLSLSDLQLLYNEINDENFSRSTINNWLRKICEVSNNNNINQ